MLSRVTALVATVSLLPVALPGAAGPAAAAPAGGGPVQVSTVELDLTGIAADVAAQLPADAPSPPEDHGELDPAPPGAPEGSLHAEHLDDESAPATLHDAVVTEPMDTESFAVLGLTWDATDQDEDVVLRYRVREDGLWAPWAAVGAAHDGPDAGGADDDGAAGRTGTDAIVVDDADGLQVWAQTPSGELTGLKAVLVDPGDDATAEPQATATGPGAPAVIPRAQWGADERQVTCAPEYGSSMMAGTVHHTASGNSYGPEDVAGMIRGMMAYHTRPEADGGRGWCDIGYNFLVDRFGRIFEGRAGGTDKPVIGVHVGGFNSRSIGVSAIGEFGSVDPTAPMLEAISQVFAWKFVMHRIDPAGTVVMISGGGASIYPEGTPVRFATVYGHRDAASTSCPGERLYQRLPDIRARVTQLVGTALDHAPRGVWESVRSTPGGVAVVGWALDPDTQAPINVDVFVDGVGTRLTADVDRPDVGAANPGAGSRHGFSATVPAASGSRLVCLYAIDTGGGINAMLGCRRVSVTGNNPIGSLDSVTETPDRGVAVTGWVVDVDTPAPLATHVYVDGVPVAVWQADSARSDVGALFPALGPNHGFAGFVPVAHGRHTVCVYGINVGSGGNVLLGCRDVTVRNRAPMGQLEAVVPFGDRVEISGWTFDPDTAATIGVHVYVDGRAVAWRADQPRADVKTRYPGQSPNHGFSGTIPVAEGRHTVCAYGIDAGGSQNALLGCTQVTVVNRAPIGSLDWVLGGGGTISVGGWAFDPDTSATIPVHAYVDGVGVPFMADRGRADVKAAFPGQAPNHGFVHDLGVPVGTTHTVCVYAINATAGPNTLLGCRVVRA